MRIVVDIRTSSPHNPWIIRSGEAWAQLWKNEKPDDDIIFLISPEQTSIEGYKCIEIPGYFGPFGKIPIFSKETREISRYVSFSRMIPYDNSIPLTLHVWSNAETFYPSQDESSFSRRLHEYYRKRILKRASTIVVPDMRIGQELVELYDIREDRVEIIPHLPLSKLHGAPLQTPSLPHPYFLYESGYGSESSITNLLMAWEQYRHHGGIYDLILLGNAGEALNGLTQTIRSLDLHESVRYLGSLDDGTLNMLYSEAKGWVSVGRYYSAGSAIELASTYQLPLLLADTPGLKGYRGLHVHPNHIIDIAKALKTLETIEQEKNPQYSNQSYYEAYVKILAKGK